MKKILLLIPYFILFNYYSFADEDFYEKGIKCLKSNNIPRAIKAFEKASEDDNALAMYKLGIIYEEKKKSNKKAIEWYKKAKKAGNTTAKYRLGVLSCKMHTYTHLNDFEEYAQTYTKKDIQYDLAVCFYENKNRLKAIKWFKKVANKNSAKAKYQVAKLSTNKKEKRKWLKRSAKSGYHLAEFELGKIFFKQHNIKESKKWLSRAKKHGSKKAIVYLKRMRSLGL